MARVSGQRVSVELTVDQVAALLHAIAFCKEDFDTQNNELFEYAASSRTMIRRLSEAENKIWRAKQEYSLRSSRRSQVLRDRLEGGAKK